MRQLDVRQKLFLGSTSILACALVVAGCQSKVSRPDEKPAVTSSLESNQISGVGVSEDRDKGVITLSGNVGTDDRKAYAETLAKQAAPDYTIANEIGVRPLEDASQAGAVASDLDSAIEKNYKAAIKAHESLDKQSIDYSAKNGTLILKGTVKTPEQKSEAETLAKHVPNVQQVVNEIEVKPTKHSTANS